MRKALAALLVVVSMGAVLAASGDDEDVYLVRAVFDNASFLIPGEDVKVAGVKVGTIARLDLTRDNKAAVVLRIDDPAFRPFRRDASCRVGLQSLIGEQFVECTPTQRRAGGVPLPPPLPRIRTGTGRGEHLLPVAQTVTPVNQDLVANVMRLPQRERLRLVINDLGAGLAGNGSALRAALRRANPALQQTERVIGVLAQQDRLLARLVERSDRVLAPLARRRKDLTGFIDSAGKTAVATADRGDALEQNFRKLPGFLRRLGPAVDDLGGLAEEMAPALETLRRQSASINATVARLGPTARLATPALVELGDTAERGRKTFPALEPTTDELVALSRPLLPLSKDLAAVSSSFDKTGGIEDTMRFIYYYTGSVNGQDQLGHYIRGALQVNVCSGRVSIVGIGCESKFEASKLAGSAAGASAAGAEDGLLDFLLGAEKR